MLIKWLTVRLWRPGIEAAISKHAFPSSWTDEFDATFVTVNKNTNSRQARMFAKLRASATAERDDLISLRTISKNVYQARLCDSDLPQNENLMSVEASFPLALFSFFIYWRRAKARRAVFADDDQAGWQSIRPSASCFRQLVFWPLRLILWQTDGQTN